MIRNRIWRQTLALIFTLLFATVSCFAAPITLTVWNSDAAPNILAWYNDVLAPAFEATHPGVDVQVVKTPWGTNYTNKIVTSYAAGVGPDIIYGGAEFVDGFVENGFVVPIDSQVSKWADWKDFIPPALGAVTYKKHVYGVPVFMDIRSMLVNPQLLLTAGYDPSKPPATWSEFLNAGKRLTRYNGNTLEVSGLFFGTNYDTFNQAVWQNGGNILNEDKSAATFNTSTGIEALTYMVNATQETTKGAAVGGYANLINGKTAMLFQGSIPRFANAAVEAKMSLDDINLSVAPPLKQKAAVAGVFTNWMGIGSQSKHPDLAWEFLKFHLDVENYVEYSAASMAVPARMSLIGSQYAKKNPWLIKALKIASGQGLATWTAVDFTSLRDALNPELAKAFQGTIPPQVALENAERLWINILTGKK